MMKFNDKKKSIELAFGYPLVSTTLLISLSIFTILLISFFIYYNHTALAFKPTVTFTVQTITVGQRPVSVAVNPSTNIIYVTNSVDNTVSLIDGKTSIVTHVISVGNGAVHPRYPNEVYVAVNPSTNIVYVTNYNGNTTSVIRENP